MSRKMLAAEAGLTEGKIWRIENKDSMSDVEEQALIACGVTAVTMPDEAPVLPRVDAIPEVKFSNPEDELPTDPIAVVNEVAPTAVEPIEVDLAALSEQAHAKQFDRYISNSELQTFKRCRRKWWLAWNRGLHEKSESPVGVRQVGNRLHRALQEHYVPGGPPSATHLLSALERLIVEDRTAALSAGWLQTDEEDKQFTKEADLERIMLEGYIEWLAQTGADADEAQLTEFDSLAIIGKIDVRVQRISDGVILFLDHKSVAEFTTTTKLLNIQEQPIHYQLLETLVAPEGQHVQGALWNMMRRVKRSATAKPPFFQRVEVRHNPIVLDSYRHRLVGEIQDILETEENLGKWPAAHNRFAYPSPTRDCSWDCPFLQVCPMFDDGSRAEHMLEERFAVGDPLDYYMAEVLREN
jgi:hypothetical protein